MPPKTQTKKQRPFDLHTFLVGKLRAATRKHPSFSEARTAAKVRVSTVYVEQKDSDAVLRVTVQEDSKTHSKGEIFDVTVYKKTASRENRVMYECAECGRLFFDYEYLPSAKTKRLKKTPMVAVDHIEPCIDPARGFESWDVYINRMFCGRLQILCNYSGLRDGVRSCHHQKTKSEREVKKTERNKIEIK